MKIYGIVLILIGLTSSVLAQQNKKVYLLKKDGKEVQTKAAGTATRQEIKNYQAGESTRISISYYSNGKVKRKTEYPRPQDAKTDIQNNIGDFSVDFKMEKRLFEGDSTGKVFVENGNGHFRETIESGIEQKIEEGDYKDGYKNGIWLGHYPNKDESFVETYSNGKMLGGETTKEGKKYRYTIIKKCAEFPGGRIGWLGYISKAEKNPVNSNGQLISGSVTPSFTIGVDGKISNVWINNSINKSLDLEAARVLYNSPTWQPAKFRGIPFEYSYSEPINFKH
ncbi:antitoxin component YwqK of YwqJK toxin-antitoxin module [Pedobacter sp. UYP30]|uniref:energy transducer TonB n=1 Tax=Pedobacter sp. UYP30 TaxID=1756400 RepID=UPI003399528E